MDRKTLICWLLQFLFSLFVSTNAGINSTMDDCIEFDMANIQELISSLQTLKIPQIDPIISVESDKEFNQPFGNFKTDWIRLNLLHNTLPENSEIKNKFKHLYRLLMIAHYQATKFSIKTDSAKFQQSFYNKQTTMAEADEISDIPVVEIGEYLASRKEQLKTILTTPISLFTGDTVNAITTESLNKALDKNSKVEETPLTITTAPNSPSDFRGSNIGNILIPITTVSDVDNKFSTTINKELQQNSVIFKPIFSLTDKNKNSLVKTREETFRVNFPMIFETFIDTSTENILKGELNNGSSNREIFSSDISLEKNPSLKSTSIDNLLISTTEQSGMIFLPSRMKSGKNLSYIEETSSTAMVTSSAPKNGFTLSISSEKSSTSSTDEAKDIFWSDFTMDPLLANNFGTEKEKLLNGETESTLKAEIYSSSTQPYSEINDYSTTSESSKVLSTENTLIVTSTDENNKVIGLKNSNKATESGVMSENSTPNTWNTKDFARSWNIESTFRSNVKIQVTPEEKPSDFSTSEKSTVTVSTTSDSIETTINVTPMIKQDDKSKGLNNQTEFFTNHKLTTNEWSATGFSEIAPFITVVTEKIQEINSASKTSEINAPIIAESIVEAISNSSTTEAFTNPTEVVDDKETPNKITQNYLSTVHPTKVNPIEISKVSEINTLSNTTNNFEIKFNEDETTTIISDTFQPISKTGIINSKPYIVKNPLNTGFSRSNNIFKDFKHSSDNSEAEKKGSSDHIVLYESGAGEKTDSVWKPSIARQSPIGNNIWRFNNSNNVRLYDYNRQLTSRINARKDLNNPPSKLTTQQDIRPNVLRSRKRGSANADVEKQFRSFYRTGETNSAHKTRDKENHNTNINIQCKKTQRR